MDSLAKFRKFHDLLKTESKWIFGATQSETIVIFEAVPFFETLRLVRAQNLSLTRVGLFIHLPVAPLVNLSLTRVGLLYTRP